MMARDRWPGLDICMCTDGWSSLIRLNREFHLKIFSLSPHQLILGEVRRLWALADLFISTKMADSQARLRTVEEHEALIECLASQDRTKCLETMVLHRASTSMGLPSMASRSES